MEPIIAEVCQGKLRGCAGTNLDGEHFYSFFGVPFAKPPVGELRFKAPVTIESWSGIRDATKEGDSCYQRNLIEQVFEGSEDCLAMNIYTRSLPSESNKLRPVMVWFYGGAFLMGSNKTDIHGPEYLMTEDVVLVIPNYRVGILGFLNLDDRELDVPGNAGLKDQVEALRWIQKNIRSFNGDPDNVTIFGVSAGSASVHYHVLSPASKGLFHKAILQSGTALNTWARSATKVMEIMDVMGVRPTDEREALDILRRASVEELYEIQEKMIEQRGTKLNLFGPVIEKPNSTAMFTKHPIEIIISGEYNHVPMIFGYTEEEGMILEFETSMEKARGIIREEKAPDLEDLIPQEMCIPKGSELSRVITAKLMETYFTGENLSRKFLILSDAIILAGIHVAIKHHLATSTDPIFLYKMTLDAGLNFLKRLAKLDHIPGACHGDDVGYLFRIPNMFVEEKGCIEDISVRRFVKLWTNFAKYGNPTPEQSEFDLVWKPVTKDDFFYLDVGENLTLKTDPEGDRLKVWDDIFRLSPVTEKY